MIVPVPQWDGKMPYSALSLVVFAWTRHWSTQKRKIPSLPKPFTVNPCTRARWMRCVGSVRQPGPAAPLLAMAMPWSWVPGFSTITGFFLLDCAISRMSSLVTTTEQVWDASVGQGLPGSWYVPG